MPQLTEDDVVDFLCRWLESDGWTILEKCKGQSRGIDIRASKSAKVLIVEAKGSRGNPNSPTTKLAKFDKGNLKTNLGEAIVKLFEEKFRYPNATLAIAQPNDKYIRSCLQNILPYVRKCGFRLFWVASPNDVCEEP